MCGEYTGGGLLERDQSEMCFPRLQLRGLGLKLRESVRSCLGGEMPSPGNYEDGACAITWHPVCRFEGTGTALGL